MTQRRLVQYLVVGVLAGMLVSACAGVASGQLALPATGDVLTVGPALDVQLAQSFNIARPGHSAQFVFEKAAQSEVESLTQTRVPLHAFCSRGGH